MRIKHSFRYCLLLLALATTGLFAEAATEPVAAVGAGHHKTLKTAKKGHKRHRSHKRHRKHRGA